MTGSSRRGFIKVAGVGAGVAAGVGLGALSATPAGAAVPHEAAASLVAPAAAPARTGSLVAYVHDLSKNQVSLMVGGSEVTVTDRRLVAALTQAMHTAARSAG